MSDKPIVGIVTKPANIYQRKHDLWSELNVKQEFADILKKYNIITIGIIPQGIELDIMNCNDMKSSCEKELSTEDRIDLIQQISLCSGIILQGGLTSHKYEVFIAEYCIENDIPILGICAGFNNIARAIELDIGRNSELSKIHDIYSPNHCHKVFIGPTAKILDDISLNEFDVNSIHQMIMYQSSINGNRNKLINIEAISTEGNEDTIEAFSLKYTKFTLAIKWHPELLPNDELTDVIFRKFSKAVNIEYAEDNSDAKSVAKLARYYNLPFDVVRRITCQKIFDILSKDISSQDDESNKK